MTSKFAGLKTHILVCLGSTVFTILSIYSFPTITASGNPVAYGDPARISAMDLRLKKGNVFTVEPGLYYPNIGGCRSEDVVVVTKSGCKILGSFPKKLEV